MRHHDDNRRAATALAWLLVTGLTAAAPSPAAAAGGADETADPRHRPHGAHAEGHAHAHPGVDLAHPIVTESPLPETHLKLRYGFADVGGGETEHGASAEVEYAFAETFSLEGVLPVAVVDAEGAGPVAGLGDVEIAAKFATYAWVEQAHLLPAVGLAVSLPTGNEERGIGTDHGVALEPFVRVGYWQGSFELVAAVGVEIPIDRDDDDVDAAVGYNLSGLYRVTEDVQVLLELHGESVFGGEREDALYLSPGVTFQPFAEKSITIGIGATLPLTDDDRDFDAALNALAIIHF